MIPDSWETVTLKAFVGKEAKETDPSDDEELFAERLRKVGVVCVILAAGKGSRFHSEVPKVLHPFAGKPLGQHAVDAAHDYGVPVVLVVGHAREKVMASSMVEKVDRVVVQEEPWGTGHAVFMVDPVIPKSYQGDLIVAYADTPGLDPDLLKNLLKQHKKNMEVHGDDYAAMILTGSRRVAGDGAKNYGRIVRRRKGLEGTVVDIVEKKQIDRMRNDETRDYAEDGLDEPTRWSKSELDEIDEFNSGIVIARATTYLDALGRTLPSQTGVDPIKFEYYATDFVKGMVAEGKIVEGWRIPSYEQHKLEGANTVEELQDLERRFQR